MTNQERRDLSDAVAEALAERDEERRAEYVEEAYWAGTPVVVTGNAGGSAYVGRLGVVQRDPGTPGSAVIVRMLDSIRPTHRFLDLPFGRDEITLVIDDEQEESTK